MLIFKIIIVSMLIFMIYNLFRALIIMNKKPLDKNDPNYVSMSKFIGRRLMFSVAMIILLLIGLLTGLITPNPTPL